MTRSTPRLDVELAWRPKERHVAIRNDDGRLVASAGLVVAALESAAGNRVALVGLGGVFVNHAHRGLGLAGPCAFGGAARRASLPAGEIRVDGLPF